MSEEQSIPVTSLFEIPEAQLKDDGFRPRPDDLGGLYLIKDYDTTESEDTSVAQ